MSDPTTQRTLTEGEYRVGITFNPGGNPLVDGIKAKAAELIDLMANLKTEGNVAAARCAALAMTQFEDGAMWAVKAVTKPMRY